MTGFSKYLDAAWGWLVLLACAGGAEWIAAHFDAGIGAMARRRARRTRHKEESRQLELEIKRRALEAANPQPIRPVCGCDHDLAFHNLESSVCHQVEASGTCPCQRYTGPEPLGQIFLPPLIDP